MSVGGGRPRSRRHSEILRGAVLRGKSVKTPKKEREISGDSRRQFEEDSGGVKGKGEEEIGACEGKERRIRKGREIWGREVRRGLGRLPRPTGPRASCSQLGPISGAGAP